MKVLNRKIMLFFVADTVLLFGSLVSAYLLRFEFSIPEKFLRPFPWLALLFIVCHVLFFHRLKLYHRVWRYAGTEELYSVVQAVTLGSISFLLLNGLLFDFLIPRSIYVMSWFITICSVGLMRLVPRCIYEFYFFQQRSAEQRKRTLIVGAGEGGKLIIKELKNSKLSCYWPVAIVDDDPRKQHLVINGLKVVGDRFSIPYIVKKMKIETIIVAIPSASGKEIKEIVHICRQTPCTIKILPCVRDWISGNVSMDVLRNIEMEDLLKREPVDLDLKEIVHYIRGKVVLVTGAGGSIGAELCRQISRFEPHQLLLLGHGENSIYEIEQQLKTSFPHLHVVPIIADIRDKKRLTDIFATFRPHIIFHAAAHKHVPLMEQHPIEAITNNVFGTKHLAELADWFQAEKFVMISTDKAVNPTSIMGATKRIAEMIVQAMNGSSATCFCAVRFGNVLGSRGSVLPTFKQQIKRGGPVTVTHPEMMRYFMTIPEAVQLVLQAGALAKGGEVFLLDMGEPVKIVDLAKDLIRLFGLEPDVDIPIVYTGIREGEKLFEELLTEKEKAAVTKNDRIFISPSESMSVIQLFSLLEKLGEYVEKRPDDVVDILGELVPSYQPAAYRKKDDRNEKDTSLFV
ncbi:FlaA1/EpsC-like NDP-sugar epimerase [Anoxybacillus voinovskiensis]|uniref:FlaA1/EpsC-like NDP-sugar epimerase n=1 Tax=Anoxybacteroides voinovskiense TaxID=230470 RepID=A0A840DU08_9BACL|nr:nucleoside-diphosphate sugar epimerase/dehydratase [Anoxybacillus voinovskiensis]MBB4073807.1 FlaA1/EpsC-like NDP-sugar epimerase [Anoxybacillus voinovskiensis]GGJ63756.1 polysaccharide biosynthesis protein [Anoxybacillus voinovskiensis]